MGDLNINGVTHAVPSGRQVHSTSGARGFRELWDNQRKTLLLFVLSLGVLISYIRLPISPDDVRTTAPRPANLHILLPASKEDENLCKVLLSAEVLGYPSPVILNWHKEFSDDGLVDGGSHLAKISGVDEYLRSLDDTHDDDLVLMIDGYDTWLQLRPQTLIDRFFDINRRADARIQAELGATTANRHHIRQEIIFGCQKRCWPWTSEDPPCYAVPQSSLPKNVYGPETDTDVGNEENPYIKYRQRYLNSGVGMGTVRAMRKLFGQALRLAEKERNFGSDQYVISHIFGDQEVWRETVRRDAMNTLDRLWNGQSTGKAYPQKHMTEVRAKAAARSDGNFEFHIGLDYESQIGLNTVFAEDDTEWLTFDDTARIQQLQANHEEGPLVNNLQQLSPDIADSLPPFWTFSHEKDLSRWTNWSQVPLFTNLWTGVVPAVIHHNAHRNGMKSLRETWWPKPWFHNHSRTLMDAHIYAPVVPLAVSGYDGREFWPYETWKGGARSGISPLGSGGDDNWIRFDHICRPYHEELFRDGKGAWELPDVH